MCILKQSEMHDSNYSHNLHPNKYCQGLHYYPFAIDLNRCVGSCNTLKDLFNRACIPEKTEDLNLSVFNMTIVINKSKILIKHISCKSECKSDGRKCNSNQKWNNDKCRCECKNPKEHHVYKEDYIWNPATCSCENSKHFASINDDSAIMCDETIETTKTVPTKIVQTKTISKKSASRNFYILLAILLITKTLLITVSIYSCLIKYRAIKSIYYHITLQITY